MTTSFVLFKHNSSKLMSSSFFFSFSFFGLNSMPHVLFTFLKKMYSLRRNYIIRLYGIGFFLA